MEDCMLLTSGQIKYEGAVPTQNEEMSPSNKSQVVLDFLEAVGRSNLVTHVFRVFGKDLQTETLHDMKQRILDSIDTIVMEAENSTEIRAARAQPIQRNFSCCWLFSSNSCSSS